MQSQYWQSSAIIITWDDYGGFYDHVPPPQIDPFGEGFRVPTLIISPWAKHGYIDHTQYEFASLLRLAEVNFNLPRLGARDTNANDMMNSFDFNQIPQPPLIEPANFIGPAVTITSINPQITNVEIATTTSTVTQDLENQVNPSWYVTLIAAAGATAIATILALIYGTKRKAAR